jgi:hypothetical protein
MYFFQNVAFALNLLVYLQKWEDQILELIATSRSSQEGLLVLQDMGKGREENQSIIASLLDFMSALARGAHEQHAGDLLGEQVPGDAAEKAFIVHKCTMQLSHAEMCGVFLLPASEADRCKFGTFEPDFLYIKKCSRDTWEITVVDAKVRSHSHDCLQMRQSTFCTLESYSRLVTESVPPLCLYRLAAKPCSATPCSLSCIAS